MPRLLQGFFATVSQAVTFHICDSVDVGHTAILSSVIAPCTVTMISPGYGTKADAVDKHVSLAPGSSNDAMEGNLVRDVCSETRNVVTASLGCQYLEHFMSILVGEPAVTRIRLSYNLRAKALQSYRIGPLSRPSEKKLPMRIS